jgi:4a-hydroxytetrahydrobiopterin dehydratase
MRGGDRVSGSELRRATSGLGRDWTVERPEGTLTLFHQFATFADAWAFLAEVARVAEDEGHYPDLSNSGDRVLIRLGGAGIGVGVGDGGVSARDLRVARRIDALLRRHRRPGLPAVASLVPAGRA